MSLLRLIATTVAVLLLAIQFPAIAADSGDIPGLASFVKLPSGVRYMDREVGHGPMLRKGEKAVVNYTGWLFDNGRKGAQFDSSYDREKPVEFTLGRHMVIRGWEQGVAGMRVGGKRTLVVPPDLAYGNSGAGGLIPPGATLVFDVELVAAKPAGAR